MQPEWYSIRTAATALWLLGSAAFTINVSRVGSYDKTYGSLGATIILLLWLYLSAYVTLIGSELNAEIERQGMRKELRRSVSPGSSPGKGDAP